MVGIFLFDEGFAIRNVISQLSVHFPLLTDKTPRSELSITEYIVGRGAARLTLDAASFAYYKLFNGFRYE